MTESQPAGRMPKAFVIRASVLAPLRQHIHANGLDYEAFLRKHGVRPKDLVDPYSVIPLARYVSLFEDAAQSLNDQSLGLRISQHLQPADIGPMGILFSLSANLQVAFERLSACVKSLQGATSSSLTKLETDFVWTYRLTSPQLWPRRQESEYTLAACCQLVRSCFTPNWRPLEVHFEHSPGQDLTLMQKIFRAPIHFNQTSNRLIIDGADARRIYRTEDTGLTRILERHIADLSSHSNEDQSFIAQVQALIELHVGQQKVNLQMIAFELGLNTKTLQRRLAAEGLTFRSMLQNHLSMLAKDRLQDKSTSVSEVAQALGYADGTVLWRAHKRWAGKPPRKPG